MFFNILSFEMADQIWWDLSTLQGNMTAWLNKSFECIFFNGNENTWLLILNAGANWYRLGNKVWFYIGESRMVIQCLNLWHLHAHEE